jgi:hypothetical protein
MKYRKPKPPKTSARRHHPQTVRREEVYNDFGLGFQALGFRADISTATSYHTAFGTSAKEYMDNTLIRIAAVAANTPSPRFSIGSQLRLLATHETRRLLSKPKDARRVNPLRGGFRGGNAKTWTGGEKLVRGVQDGSKKTVIIVPTPTNSLLASAVRS